MGDESKEEYPSLRFTANATLRALDAQVDQIKGIDTKAGLVLGASGVILAVLVGPSWVQDHTKTTTVLLALALGAFSFASACAVAAIWPRRVDIPPNPTRLFDEYLTRPEAETLHEVVKRQVDVYETNESAIGTKSTTLKYSALSFMAGIALLGILALYDSITLGGSSNMNEKIPQPTTSVTRKPADPSPSPQPTTRPASQPSDSGLSSPQTRGAQVPFQK